MSRRNSSNRRRTYGRRLHEVHERRATREAGPLDWLGENDDADAGGGPAVGGAGRPDYHDDLRDARGRAA